MRQSFLTITQMTACTNIASSIMHIFQSVNLKIYGCEYVNDWTYILKDWCYSKQELTRIAPSELISFGNKFCFFVDKKCPNYMASDVIN